MRIAVLNRTFATTGGGAESYSVNVVRELAATHEVHVFCQRTDEPVAGVTYHHVPHLSEKPRWLNQLWFALATWWMTRGGFVVHAHENTWHGQVHTIHVRPTRYNLLHGRSGWRLALRWLKVASSPRLLTYLWLEGARFKPGKTVVATSEALAQECRAAYPGVHIDVITPGVRLPQTHLSKAEARQQLGLPQDVPLILFVANDYARKGLDTLLQALTELPGVHLAVVGSRNPQAEFEAKAHKLGVNARVHFLGPRQDVSPAYQAADVLAHPTMEDTFAMVVLEAMAHGLPVVVSGPEYCGISAQLVHGQQALLLDDPKDASALAKHLAELLKDQGKSHVVQCLTKEGQAFAAKHTWQQASQAYELPLAKYKLIN
jgi:UDP-glucose:(heptosyl)LPS alpha-1,3-glucosyltransferase